MRESNYFQTPKVCPPISSRSTNNRSERGHERGRIHACGLGGVWKWFIGLLSLGGVLRSDSNDVSVTCENSAPFPIIAVHVAINFPSSLFQGIPDAHHPCDVSPTPLPLTSHNFLPPQPQRKIKAAQSQHSSPESHALQHHLHPAAPPQTLNHHHHHHFQTRTASHFFPTSAG